MTSKLRPALLLSRLGPLLLCAALCLPLSGRAWSRAPEYGAGDGTGHAPASFAPLSPLTRLEDPRNGDLPWRLAADKVVSLNDGMIVEAMGDVVLTRGGDYLKADFARFFTSTNWVYISGGVSVRLGRDELTASEAEFDLSSNTGWLHDGHVFMDGPHVYFQGENVTKHWGDSYTFENAKITACDDPVPAWSLTAQSARVEIDGYATLSRSAFQVMDRSVLFAPYMILPAKTTRQSGLLQPDAGASSLHGLYYSQPWFWAMSDDRDMTFYGTWMERSGFMPSVEYRSQTSDKARTWMSLDALYDSDAFLSEAGDPIDGNDGSIRANHVRYWMRGMGQGELLSGWRYKYTLDYVSDQNYLREFQQRITGFDRSRSALFDLFGRDLQEVDKNRISAGFIYRDWDRARLSLGLRYEQNSALGHGNPGLSTDTTPQSLPRIEAFLFKGRIFPDLPLEAEASASSAYMHRFSGASGLRSEVYPRLSLPLDLKYATVIATGGLRQTFYHNTKQRAVSPLAPNTSWTSGHFGTSRTVPHLNLQAFTQASRVWELSPPALEAVPENAGQTRWTGLRHIIQPRLDYSLVPVVDQKSNPFYFLDDRILPTNAISFSLANLLTVRRQTVLPDPVPEGESAPRSASLAQDYRELLRVRLGAGYDFGEATRTRHAELFPRRPIMDLTAEVDVQVNSWFGLWSQAYLSMYGKGVTRSDQGLSLSNARWGSLNLGHSSRSREYDYLRQVQYENLEDVIFQEPLTLLTTDLKLRLTSNWNIAVASNFNLDSGNRYEDRISLSYTHQCYRLTGRFLSKGRERSVQFNIELLGLN